HELRYDALLYLPHVAAGTTRALRMDVTEYVQCAVHGETDDLFGCGDAFRLRLPRGLVQVDVHVADGRLTLLVEREGDDVGGTFAGEVLSVQLGDCLVADECDRYRAVAHALRREGCAHGIAHELADRAHAALHETTRSGAYAVIETDRYADGHRAPACLSAGGSA